MCSGRVSTSYTLLRKYYSCDDLSVECLSGKKKVEESLKERESRCVSRAVGWEKSFEFESSLRDFPCDAALYAGLFFEEREFNIHGYGGGGGKYLRAGISDRCDADASIYVCAIFGEWGLDFGGTKDLGVFAIRGFLGAD